jgi:F-type H+-transporting ATPase subunit b
MIRVFASPSLLALGEEVVDDHEPSGVDLLLPPTAELIAGLIAFAIIFAFVWKWALPAVNRMLEARQQAITGQLQEAEKSKEDAEKLLQDYKAQLASAKEEAAKIKAREDAAAERERVTAGLRDEVASLSLDLAQKVVVGSIDAKAQKALVEKYMSDLEGIS